MTFVLNKTIENDDDDDLYFYGISFDHKFRDV